MRHGTTILELIEKLTVLHDEHGDLNIMLHDYSTDYAGRIYNVEYDGHNGVLICFYGDQNY